MFDPERLLGQLITDGMSRKKKKKSHGFSTATKLKLGAGLLGLAFAAYEHIKDKRAQPTPHPGSALPPAPPTPPRPPAAPVALPRTPPEPPRPPVAAPTAPPVPVPATPPPASPSAAGWVSAFPDRPPAPAPATGPDLAPVPATAATGAATTAGSGATDGGQRQADLVLLIRAMIAAAHADGSIDAEERAAILERALQAGLDADTQRFLLAELNQPASAATIVAATRPELRFEVYAASVLAIQLDTPAERDYLDRLAAGLGLGLDERAEIHRELGVD